MFEFFYSFFFCVGIVMCFFCVLGCLMRVLELFVLFWIIFSLGVISFLGVWVGILVDVWLLVLWVIFDDYCCFNLILKDLYFVDVKRIIYELLVVYMCYIFGRLMLFLCYYVLELRLGFDGLVVNNSKSLFVVFGLLEVVIFF